MAAGARGRAGGLTWSAGVFRAVNHDDLLFLASEQTGFGYFANVEKTRRQGMEISRRLGQRDAAMDRVVLGMQVVEGIGTAASIAIGGGVIAAAALAVWL